MCRVSSLLDDETFLQGSYANSTNTYDDSDIDVVVLNEGEISRVVLQHEVLPIVDWQS